MFLISPKYWTLLLLLISTNTGVWAQLEKKVRPKESDVLLEKLFIEANREKILGNIDEAIHTYMEVLQKDNMNAAANYELARLYKRQEQFDKAIIRAEQAVEIEPDNLTYNNLYASLLEKEANYKKAAELYAGLVNKYPNNKQLYFDWAYFLSKNGKPDQAIKVYSNLEKRIGVKETISMRKYKLYMKMGKSKKASQEIEKLIETYPQEAEYIIRLANFYASSQDLEKAKALYQKALDIEPNNPTANMAMVEFFLQSGDTTRYLNALMNTFENPQQSLGSKIKTLNRLSQALKAGQLQAHKEAILELSLRLTQTHPTNAHANVLRGDLLFQQQQYNAALKCYTIASKSMTNNLKLWQNLLECLHITDHQEELQKQSKEMIAIYPSQASSFYYHGIALFQQKDYKKATKEFQQAIEIAVADMVIQGKCLRYLAKIYDNTEATFDKADKAFNESILLHPNDNETIHDYAYGLAKRNLELEKAFVF